MKTRSMRIWFPLLIMVALTTGTIWPVAARGNQPEAAGQSVMLRLKYATFDPLLGEPSMPPALHTDAHRGTGEGAYIVQFKGPVQGAWTDQIRALGGRVTDYLPDFSYLVWMDGATQKQVAALDTVRWVGLYQPAYKLSPNLDRTKPIYRVVLFEGSDLGAVSARLADLNTPTRQVAGEQFALLLPEGGVDEVANWPEVLWIENRPLYRLHNDVATGIMGATTAWANGYTGKDQMVTVADTGIDSGVDGPAAGDIHPDFDNRMAHISSWPVVDWCSGCCVTNTGANDGPDDVASGHGTHVLGSVLGNGEASSETIKGTAYEAVPTFQAVEQYTTFTTYCKNTYDYADGYELFGLPLDLKDLFQEAYDWGSRIHSNSWGSPAMGQYTVDSQAVDQFMWSNPDMLIVFSAGNMGTDKSPKDGYVDVDSLDAPGTAKNALTVGASDNSRLSGGLNPGSSWCYTWGTCWSDAFQANPTAGDWISDNAAELAAFSSRGPANDGRRKPDVVAPGTNILSTCSQVATGTGWGTHANTYYLYMGGTSMATPLTAGTVAQVRQYYVEGLGHTTPSAALLKATLINSAVDIPGYGTTNREAGLPIPNDHEGWGRVDVGAATSGDREFVDGDSVGTGGTGGPYTYDIASSATPFKVTLVWSDYPAAPSSGGLVDDLDLVVTAPDGTTTYYGNYFSGGWSVPGISADRTNNVESVYVQNPAVGQWTVRVAGYNVPAPGNQQPFALVATGLFGPPPPPPVAAFSGSPTSGQSPLEVSFTDLSTGEITSWEWDFGDTGSSPTQNPTHIYSDVGDHTVSLTVTGPGGSNTETKINYIHVSEPATLVVSPVTGAPDSYFAFTGQNFTPLSDATISVNGTDLVQTVPTGAAGEVAFNLDTVNLFSGRYFVTVRTNPSASTYFDLDLAEPLSQVLGSGPLIAVPGTIGPAARVYLPLVMRAYTPPVPDDPIVNGDFEAGSGVGWDEYSLNDFPIVMNSGFLITPHSGIWLAWLGGWSYEIAYFEQTVTIPSGRSYLHYWHWLDSSNTTCSTEQASLLVNGTMPVKTYALCTATNTPGWVEQVVDLGAYAGQSVLLRFQAETSLSASSWYVDDVSFEVSAAAADVSVPVAPDPGLSPARKVKIAPDTPQP